MFVWFKIVLPLVHPWFHFAILANKIYINKVAVYVFVCLEHFPLQSPTFLSQLPKSYFKLVPPVEKPPIQLPTFVS